jgi:hypothetical protein
MGPAGEPGVKGDKGDPGTGLIIWKGEHPSAPANPEQNWAYYDSTTGNAYIYSGTNWDLLAAGGANGSDGVSIIWKGSLAAAPASPQLNWAYYNTADGKSYIYDGAAWQILAQDGAVGPAGPQGPEGPEGPAGSGSSPQSLIITIPTRTGYFTGNAFRTAGLSVRAAYADGSNVTVHSGYTVTWNNQPINDGDTAITAAAGTKTVTVNWHGAAEDFTVSVTLAGVPIPVSSAAEWATALNAIKNAENGTAGEWKDYTIQVTGDFAVPGSTAYAFGTLQYVTVNLTGNGTVNLNSQGNLLRLGRDQTLVIDGPTLRGLKNGENGATQDNNTAAVCLNHADSTLELRSGAISDNRNSDIRGGGVYVYSGSFTMSGGEISGNSSVYVGGGVYVGTGSFTMSGGKISGNLSVGGGGVYVSDGTFTMSGGEISGNSSSSGGGVYVVSNSSFSKSGGGIIYGYDSGTPTDPLWNKAASNGFSTYGHAVFFGRDNGYYRDTTLDTGDDISTGTLPGSATGSYDSTNWIKQ